MSSEIMRRLKFYFRVVDVSKVVTESICQELPDFTFELNKFKKSQNIVMLLKIEDGKDYSALFDLMNYQKDLKKGVFISIVTESDSDGLTVPDFVSAFIKNIHNVTIDFSFTCV